VVEAVPDELVLKQRLFADLHTMCEAKTVFSTNSINLHAVRANTRARTRAHTHARARAHMHARTHARTHAQTREAMSNKTAVSTGRCWGAATRPRHAADVWHSLPASGQRHRRGPIQPSVPLLQLPVPLLQRIQTSIAWRELTMARYAIGCKHR
jgi:hypothetical protein